jgi:mRNA-degrading endonuclease RelE of RelBE toxin-antitoxin system
MWIYLNLDISRLSPQEEKRYRLRIWKYRVIYKKEDEILLITVIKIWSRWDVYK